MSNEQQFHFFASCGLGWATADTRDEAIRKLVSAFRREFKQMTKNLQKSGDAAGGYIWSVQVHAPASAHYRIEFYAPKGVELSEAQEHATTYVTDKAISYTRTYHQEAMNYKHELQDLKAARQQEDTAA